MAYTTHGHQIPGTRVEGERPAKVARCGGPGLCHACSVELHAGLRQEFREVNRIQTDSSLKPEDQACVLVAQYFNARAEVTEEIPLLTLKDVSIVSFVKIAGSWKATVKTNVPDGHYYEVVRNQRRKETYLTVYIETDSIVVSDDPNTLPRRTDG